MKNKYLEKIASWDEGSTLDKEAAVVSFKAISGVGRRLSKKVLPSAKPAAKTVSTGTSAAETAAQHARAADYMANNPMMRRGAVNVTTAPAAPTTVAKAVENRRTTSTMRRAPRRGRQAATAAPTEKLMTPDSLKERFGGLHNNQAAPAAQSEKLMTPDSLKERFGGLHNNQAAPSTSRGVTVSDKAERSVIDTRNAQNRQAYNDKRTKVAPAAPATPHNAPATPGTGHSGTQPTAPAAAPQQSFSDKMKGHLDSAKEEWNKLDQGTRDKIKYGAGGLAAGVVAAKAMSSNRQSPPSTPYY